MVYLIVYNSKRLRNWLGLVLPGMISSCTFNMVSPAVYEFENAGEFSVRGGPHIKGWQAGGGVAVSNEYFLEGGYKKQSAENNLLSQGVPYEFSTQFLGFGYSKMLGQMNRIQVTGGYTSAWIFEEQHRGPSVNNSSKEYTSRAWRSGYYICPAWILRPGKNVKGRIGPGMGAYLRFSDFHVVDSRRYVKHIQVPDWSGIYNYRLQGYEFGLIWKVNQGRYVNVSLVPGIAMYGNKQSGADTFDAFVRFVLEFKWAKPGS